MSQHYVDRKHCIDEVKHFHPDSEKILGRTYGILIYQEQAMELARYFAGFTLQQADSLRKAIGKKLPELMAKCRVEFLEGCKNTKILTDKEAEDLFDNIEKSNRYSFNKSHAVSYAIIGYQMAWFKAHFPLHFYCASLLMAENKMKPREQIKELILDSLYFRIPILPPDIRAKETKFHLESGSIRFGIGDIKDVGGSKIEKAERVIEAAELRLNKKIADFSYYEMLMYILVDLDKTTATNLILVGAVSGFGFSRKRTLFEYKKAVSLTEKELNWIKENSFNDILSAFQGLIQAKVPNKKRVLIIEDLLKSLETPPEDLTDSVDYIASIEDELLGISLACSKLDGCDTSMSNTTCAEFLSGKDGKSLTFAVQVDSIREWFPKDAKIPLIFADCHDATGSLNCMLPSNLYEDYSPVLFKNNTVLISGYRNNKGGLNIKKVIQL